MSTRATYKIGDYTAYIHHDGYPEYAVPNYIVPILRHAHMDNFIRKNDGAELTLSHQAHGDTDYTYTITGSFVDRLSLSICKRFRSDSGESKLVEIHFGDLADVCNAYLPENEKIKYVKVGYAYGYYTYAKLLESLGASFNYHFEYMKKHPLCVGNIEPNFRRVSEINEALISWEDL